VKYDGLRFAGDVGQSGAGFDAPPRRKSCRWPDPAKWHYGPTFDGQKAVRQYAEFASLIETSGAEILWLEDTGDGLADAMFTHDPSLMSDHGAIILRMGKPLRAGETGTA